MRCQASQFSAWVNHQKWSIWQAPRYIFRSLNHFFGAPMLCLSVESLPHSRILYRQRFPILEKCPFQEIQYWWQSIYIYIYVICKLMRKPSVVYWFAEQYGFLWLSLTIHPYWPSYLLKSLEGTYCLHRADKDFAGHLVLVCPCVGVHKRMSITILSLPL